MTVNNDLCDFCGHFLDPIGCDTARVVYDSYWCGQCEPGLIWQFRLRSNKDLVTLADKCQDAMTASGLSWENRGTSTGDWINHLRYSDTLAYIKREQDRRQKMMDSVPGLFKAGYTFWSAPDD